MNDFRSKDNDCWINNGNALTLWGLISLILKNMKPISNSLILIFSLFVLFNGTCAFAEDTACSSDWPLLKHYDQEYTHRIAMPLGGIGTGTISLGGRGNLQDFEIMNRPAKGYNPSFGRGHSPFFVLYTNTEGARDLRLLEGPVPFFLYEGGHGAVATNHGLPRFRNVSFDAAYPFGQVNLSTPEVPLDVKIKAFNPLIPGDADKSGIPMAVLVFELINTSEKGVIFSVAGTMQNFIGEDGTEGQAMSNKNAYREDNGFKGIFFESEGLDKNATQWGEMALVTDSKGKVTYRTAWKPTGWGSSILDFWDDMSIDGELEERVDNDSSKPVASISVGDTIKPGERKIVRFLITWYFPNRRAWSEETMRNYYSTKYDGAWDVAGKTIPLLPQLESKTIEFVKAFIESDLSESVKESALFNISTLRTETVFRLSDGNLFAWEGSSDRVGCCWGSCTHVWNYETAAGFLFGDLAKTRRKVEFAHATTDDGIMSFRVSLPLINASKWKRVAADGQMGTIMKLYKEWQLSGDDEFLKDLYPKAKSALSYAWIKGGWDADQDGVMEGVQHNTMDVEYFGPNPQMTVWYLGALRAMEEMSTYLNDLEFAAKCRRLFENGSNWVDENLFNGEYYFHQIIIPDNENIPDEQLVGMGATDFEKPDYQLGEGCLVDQLVGQYFAHVCGLGYLLKEENVKKTMQSIMKYNYRSDLTGHFNIMRSYALGDEAGLLMASYPKSRPENPFPYFTEVMTGFEYSAAIGMLYEGQVENGLKSIKSIRDRYDGRKRSPFNEAECGHHYGRAMASWSAVLALTGFQYSGVSNEMSFNNLAGNYFWSTGYAWGTVEMKDGTRGKEVDLVVLKGEINIREFAVKAIGSKSFLETKSLKSGDIISFIVSK